MSWGSTVVIDDGTELTRAVFQGRPLACQRDVPRGS